MRIWVYKFGLVAESKLPIRPAVPKSQRIGLEVWLSRRELAWRFDCKHNDIVSHSDNSSTLKSKDGNTKVSNHEVRIV